MIFSVWLRTGSNPVNINRFQSYTGNYILFYQETDLIGESEVEVEKVEDATGDDSGEVEEDPAAGADIRFPQVP